MKYIRKLVALFILVVFLASVAIGVGVIFAVRNVNITLMCYEIDEESGKAEIKQLKGQIFDEVQGSLITLVGKEDISEAVGDNKYIVEEFRRVYPCTINVTLRERMELFAVVSGDNYNIHDERGAFSRSVPVNDEAQTEDITRFVLLENVQSNSDLERVAKACADFKNAFGSFGAVTEKVSLNRAQAQSDKDRLVFYLKSGLKIEIQDFEVFTAKKAEIAYLKFSDLKGSEKLGGTIYCFATTSAEETVRATYNKNV